MNITGTICPFSSIVRREKCNFALITILVDYVAKKHFGNHR